MSTQIAQLWDVFCKHWDKVVMSNDGSLSYAAITDMDRMVVASDTDLPGIAAMFWASSTLSQAIGSEARWLAGCFCHRELVQELPLYTKRVKALEEMGIKGGMCCWFGRRGPSLALGEVDNICRRILHASSDGYRAALVAAPERV